MTAKELADNAYGHIMDPFDESYCFTVDEFKAFIDQLCKEQRENCANECFEINFGEDEVFAALVRNAKQPEI